VLVKSVAIASSAGSWSLSLVFVQPRIVAKPRRKKAIGFKTLVYKDGGCCVDRLSPPPKDSMVYVKERVRRAGSNSVLWV